MNIGLDFDDVIVRTHTLKTQVARELFGVEIPAADFKREIVVGKGILTNDQYTEVGREVYSGNHPFIAVENALEGMREFQQAGHSLRIITARSHSQGILASAEKWLASQGFNLTFAGVGYGLSKKEACEGLDLFVDDDKDNLKPLLGAVPHLLLFAWPHDNYPHAPLGMKMVYTWSDIMQYVRMVSGQ